MLITGKRKRKLDKKLLSFADGSKVIPGLAINDQLKDLLFEIGFTTDLNVGETVLPPSKFGPVCRYNAEGKIVIHKNKPMETAYRQVEWTWEQWAGYWGTETQSKIVDVPYQRYPRTLIPPPCIELSVTQNPESEKFIVAPDHEINFQEPDALLHAINIFLEIFGQCEVLSEDLQGYTIANVTRLNWKILPPGKWPWEKVEKEVKPLVDQASEQNQIVIRYRLQAITAFDPEFVAIGQAGFSGYLIFGFPKKNLYVLESLYSGNATYVFEEEWEELSKLTKAQILQENLQKDRIIHREPWKAKVDKLLE